MNTTSKSNNTDSILNTTSNNNKEVSDWHDQNSCCYSIVGNEEDSIDEYSTMTQRTHKNMFNHIPQESVVIENSDHFITMKNNHLKQLSNLSYDTQYIDSLELVKGLMLKNISFSNYEFFMKWKHGKKNSSINSASYMSLNKLKKTVLSRVYGNQEFQHKMMPKYTLLNCPSGRAFNVITYDIDAMIYDLLSDKNLTCSKNMIFNSSNINNPFKINLNDCYNEFDQSEYYNETIKKYKSEQNTNGIDPSKLLVVPIVIYMDETNLDNYNNLSLHPVTMSLMIYNQKARNLERSWRTIGYIPNFTAMVGNKSVSGEAKLNDFHFILQHVLDGLKKLQSRPSGFQWVFEFDEYENKKYEMTLKFPLAFVIGDGKGNDTICGKKQNRNTAKRLCRDCNVLLQKSDDPNVGCNFHKMSTLEAMTEVELADNSFYKIICGNAFSGMDFGANPYGINGATPPDPCHQINKGIPERLPTIFMDRLSTSQVSTIDIQCAIVCVRSKRQSDRSLPCINPFIYGLSEKSKLRADQNIGRVFSIFITLLTTDCESKIVGKPGKKEDIHTPATIITQQEYNQWVLLFEEVLILISWIYLESHPKVVFKGGKNSLACERMRMFMTRFKTTANRTKGMGLKLMKWHQLLHLWMYIRMYGSLYAVDSARSESHHRKKKQIASHTQRRIIVLDHQTAQHEFTYNSFLKGMLKANIKLDDKFESFQLSDKMDNENNISLNHNGSRFVLTFNYEDNIVTGEWKSKKFNREFDFPRHILSSIYSKLNNYNHNEAGRRIKTIDGFTEYQLTVDETDELHVFRSCPNYRMEGHWFDWAYVNWGEDFGNLPSQLLLFLDMSSMTFESANNNTIPNNPIVYKNAVLVHSAKYEENIQKLKKKYSDNNNLNSQIPLITRIVSFYDMERNYQLIDIDSLYKACYVVVDKLGVLGNKDFTPGNTEKIIVIESMSQWHYHFLDYRDNRLLLDSAKRENEKFELGMDEFPYEG